MTLKINRWIWYVSAALFLSALTACKPSPPPVTSTTGLPAGATPLVAQTSGGIDLATAPNPAVPTPPPVYPSPTTPAFLATAYPPPTAEGAPGIIPETGPALAFLQDGDIWILDQVGSEPYPLTVAGDILGFTWSPTGERLAAFNGHTLCFYYRDGSVRSACLDLGLDDEQAAVERRLALSPDQRWIVLWNPVNAQDEDAIGWMIVALDTTNDMFRIGNPVEWGAALTPENEPGGFTGQPIFLPDGRLIGTLSHQTLCEANGCSYQLFTFDLQNRAFTPFADQSEEGFLAGLYLDLSRDGGQLINYGTTFAGCETYATTVNTFDLASSGRQTQQLDGDALVGLSFDPSMGQAVIARTSGCINPDLVNWATTCGLSEGVEVQPMQMWKPADPQRSDLVPGTMPRWSPDGNWVAFRSCLAQDASGVWGPSETDPPAIFLINPENGEILAVQEGTLPEWQPVP